MIGVNMSNYIKLMDGTKSNAGGYGCEEAERCCNFNCEYCKIDERQYLQVTGKKPSNKNVKELKEGLKSLNDEIKFLKYIPFDEYEIVEN